MMPLWLLVLLVQLGCCILGSLLGWLFYRWVVKK